MRQHIYKLATLNFMIHVFICEKDSIMMLENLVDDALA